VKGVIASSVKAGVCAHSVFIKKDILII